MLTRLLAKTGILCLVFSIVLISGMTHNAFAAYSHPAGLHTQAQIDEVKQYIQNNVEPYKSAYTAFLVRANEGLSRTLSATATYYVPGYYVDPEGSIAAMSAMSGDAYYAYTTALAWKLSGIASYAEKARTILNNWATVCTSISSSDDTPLVCGTAGVGLINAADLLTDYSGWASSEQTTFKNWVTNKYLPQINSIKTRTNNWGAWGTLGAITTYCYLDDNTNVQNEINRLKGLIDSQIASDGHMPAETSREYNSMWYTYYALVPLTEAAQVAYNAEGVDVFNYTSSNGHSLKLALDYFLTYVQNPSSWPWYTGNDLTLPVLASGTGLDINNCTNWPTNLFEAMSGIYNDTNYSNLVSSYRPVLGGWANGRGPHHNAWCFPTLMKPSYIQNSYSGLGMNVPGGTSQTTSSNYLIADYINPSQNVSVTSLNLYVASNATGKVRMGLYNDSAGSPGSLLAQTGEVTLANGWNSGMISSTNLSAGTKYWIVFNLSQTGSVLTYNSESNAEKYISYTYPTSLPSTAPAGMASSFGRYAFYASASASSSSFSDDFEDGNSNGWSIVNGGTWSVITDGSKVYNQSNNTVSGATATAGDINWTNYEFSSKLKVNSFGSPAGIGLYGRYQDASHAYTFQYYTSGNLLMIQKNVGGTITTLVSKSYTFNTGTWYTFKAVLNGSTLQLYVNGVLELTATDSTYSSGKIGLDAHRSNANFDDIKVSQIYFSDDFEDGNANGWSIVNGGTWSIITDGNKVYNQSNNTVSGATATAGDINWTNYEFSSKLKANSFGSPAGIGLYGRYQDASHAYTFQYYTSGNLLMIQKNVGGTITTLVSKSYTFNTGTWYTFKAVLNGSTLQLYVNGVLELTATDSTYSSGKIGLDAHRSSANFDDISVLSY